MHAFHILAGVISNISIDLSQKTDPRDHGHMIIMHEVCVFLDSETRQPTQQWMCMPQSPGTPEHAPRSVVEVQQLVSTSPCRLSL